MVLRDAIHYEYPSVFYSPIEFIMYILPVLCIPGATVVNIDMITFSYWRSPYIQKASLSKSTEIFLVA